MTLLLLTDMRSHTALLWLSLKITLQWRHKYTVVKAIRCPFLQYINWKNSTGTFISFTSSTEQSNNGAEQYCKTNSSKIYHKDKTIMERENIKQFPYMQSHDGIINTFSNSIWKLDVCPAEDKRDPRQIQYETSFSCIS